MSRKKGSTKFKQVSRVTQVYKMLLLGLDVDAIQERARELDWRVGERAVRHYMQQATARFEEESKQDRTEERGKAIARITNVYARSILKGDFRCALAAQTELNKLFDLYAPGRIEVSGSVEVTTSDDLSVLTDEELSYARRIRAKLDGSG